MINLQFEGCRNDGRTIEIAKIGKVAVGEVELTPNGRFFAAWTCYLDPERKPHVAYSVAQAKAGLAHHVTEWTRKAGLHEGIAA